MEMHASSFGKSGTNYSREGEGTGRQGPGKQGREKRLAFVWLSLGLSTAEVRSQPAGEEPALLNPLVVWWGHVTDWLSGAA